MTLYEKAFKILKATLAAGVNVWNGAEIYGTPDNNSLHQMNRYFTAYPEDAGKVVLTTEVVSLTCARSQWMLPQQRCATS